MLCLHVQVAMPAVEWVLLHSCLTSRVQQVYGECTRQVIDTLHYILHTVATREAGGHFGTPRAPPPGHTTDAIRQLIVVSGPDSR